MSKMLWIPPNGVVSLLRYGVQSDTTYRVEKDGKGSILLTPVERRKP